MSAYNVISPTSMVGGQPEDISPVKANFDAIAAVINGNIDQTNIAITSTPTVTALTVSQNNKLAITLSGAAAGLTIGGDSNLYRNAAASLATDGNFVSRPATTGQVSLTTPGGNPGVAFGLTLDTSIYRGGVNNLQSNGSFQSTFWLGTGPVNVGHSLPGLALYSTGGVTGATTADHGFLFWDGTNLKFRKPSSGTTTILV